jgi:hypothetical protein
MIKTITIEDIESVVGFKISEHCKGLINKFDLQYTEPTQQERDDIILDIINALNTELETAGKHKLEKWEKGWLENLELLKEHKDASSLVPKYFGKHKIARWKGDFIQCVTEYFDYKLHIILVDAILNEYVGDKYNNLYEFGCGPAYHLMRFRDFNNDINLVGLDWASSSQSIINEIRDLGITSNISGHNFDYFEPDYKIEIPEKTAMFTCASLEQMGENYKDFVNYLLFKKPDLCINFEPMSELLDETNLVDKLSLLYFTKRNYLKNYLTYLRELESEGKIEIIKEQRLYGGSYFIEGYPIVIWKPIK